MNKIVQNILILFYYYQITFSCFTCFLCSCSYVYLTVCFVSAVYVSIVYFSLIYINTGCVFKEWHTVSSYCSWHDLQIWLSVSIQYIMSVTNQAKLHKCNNWSLYDIVHAFKFICLVIDPCLGKLCVQNVELLHLISWHKSLQS